ncbi:MAG TPA: C69 family dipeptidase [Nocardioidaceae bacterium]|nr:C69 family dipeptidase [Nocardioidaceae bacterium]
MAYLEIQEVTQTWAHLGASPYWCWGHELGLNEWGVAIGNEALFTRDLACQVAQYRAGRPPEPGLLGMELLRLALERATTAAEAVDVITDLLEEHGQWGCGVPGRSTDDGAYDNSYLIADPRDAWVLESSGRHWAARSLDHAPYSVSNQLTIRTHWDRASHDLARHATEAGWWPLEAPGRFDFARAYTDPGTPLQLSHPRLSRSRQMLRDAADRGPVGHRDAVRVLRDHYEGTFLEGPYFSAARPDLLTLCMHDSPGGFTWGNTASSTLMRLPASPDRLPHMWWAAGPPCTGVYIPVFPAAQQVPSELAAPAAPTVPPRPEDVPAARFGSDSYWWHFARLLDQVTGGPEAWHYQDRQPEARRVFDQLERRWEEELPIVEATAAQLLATGDDKGAAVLHEFTEKCVRQALQACDELTRHFGALGSSV